MAKDKVYYKCTNCGNISERFWGKCLACGEVDTLERHVERDTAAATSGMKSTGAMKPERRALTISQLSNKPFNRTSSGIGELDRVLGGGFVDGEVVLLGGSPGAGKSSLSIAVADNYAQRGMKVLYCSGEESEQQIALRAKRLSISSDNIKIVNENNLETILGHVDEEKPDFLILDSLQTVASKDITGGMGSISQSKEAANVLTKLAKSRGISMILVSQVIKGGEEFAGSNQIAHVVDCALMFESDRESPLKFLRSTKNRFGDVNEVGVFQHEETGLMEVTDPSGIFLETEDDDVYGTICSFISEGVRQMPIEVQSLVTKSTLPTPRKQFSGVNYQRGQIVCAILDKFLAAKLFENDVFVSTVSGVRVEDPQADLAVAAAIMSSLKAKAVPTEYAFVGELSLTGQVRGGFMVENKIKEAERLGFKKIILPKAAQRSVSGKYSIDIEYVRSVKDLAKYL